MPTWDRIEVDGNGDLYRWANEDGRRYRVHTSLNEARIIEQNKRIQAAGGARQTTFGRGVMRMPKAVHWMLVKRYPALNSPDAQEQMKAIEKLSRDPDYRYLFVGRP